MCDESIQRSLVVIDALNNIINLIATLGFELDLFVDGSETFNQFVVELQFLKKNVQ
jgi:hypothetical protein